MRALVEGEVKTRSKIGIGTTPSLYEGREMVKTTFFPIFIMFETK